LPAPLPAHCPLATSDYQTNIIHKHVNKAHVYAKANFDIKKTAEQYAEL